VIVEETDEEFEVNARIWNNFAKLRIVPEVQSQSFITQRRQQNSDFVKKRSNQIEIKSEDYLSTMPTYNLIQPTTTSIQ
jgi:hypothetical protein